MAEFLDITKNLLVSLNASFKLQYPFIELNFCDKFVYIKNGDKVEQKSIKTGVTNGINTQIIEGLNEGEEVIYFYLNSTGVQNMMNGSRKPAMRL